jgi:hypothetical protein
MAAPTEEELQATRKRFEDEAWKAAQLAATLIAGQSAAGKTLKQDDAVQQAKSILIHARRGATP